MARKMFTCIVLLVMLGIGGIKVFTRMLLFEGEAGAGCLVATYMPALDMYLYERGNGNIYEAEYRESIVLEERAGYVDPKQPIRFHLVALTCFQDGSYSSPIYTWLFVHHIWHIEGYLMPFLLMGILLMISEKYRMKKVSK